MDALNILALGLAAKGGSGGTSDYSDLTNKPQINDVTLSGNKSLEDLGIPTYSAGTNVSIDNGVISATDTTYSAGTNVSIDNGVISATDTTYSAGTGIDITSDVISIDNTVALKSDIPAAELPTITSSDSGKVLKVNSNHDGVEWSAESTELPTITGNANKVLKVNSGATAVEWANEAAELPTISSGDAGKVLTVNSGETGVEWASGGGGSSYTFTNGLTETSGTVSWDLNDRVKAGSATNSIIIGNTPSTHTSVNGIGSAFIGSNLNGYVNTNNHGSVVLGYASYGHLAAQSPGSIVLGSAEHSNSRMQAMNNGAIAAGYCSDTSHIDATGYGSIAAGRANSAYGSIYAYKNGQIALGCGVQCSNVNGTDGQVVLGKCNATTDLSDKIFVIGNGTSNSARSNALTVDWNGNLVCNNIPAPPAGDGTYNLQCTVSSGVATYTWVAQS